MFVLLCCFLGGVALFYVYGGIRISYIGSILLACASIFFVIPSFRRYVLVVVFGCVFLGIGQWYGMWYEYIHVVPQSALDGVYEGSVSSSPRLYDSYQFFIVKDDESGMSIGVFSSLDSGVSYGDNIVLHDELEPLSSDTAYLKARGVDYVSFFPSVFSVSEGEGSVLRSLYAFRESIVLSLRSVLPFDEASFAAGTIIGRDSVSFSDDLVEKLIGSGIIHVVALSGYNVSVVVFVIALLFRFFLSRRWSVGMSLLCVWVFVVLVGAEASVVRAAAMASIVLIGTLLSRPQWHWYVMVCVAVGMVLFRPSILVYDVGFLLSFSALWGILYCAPRLVGIVSWSSSFGYTLWKIFVETLSAQIGALPILLFFFSSVSFGGLIANVIILPLIPFIMLGAGIVGIGGLVSWGISYIGSLFLSVLIDISLWVSTVCSYIGTIDVSFPFIGVVAYYVSVVYILGRYTRSSVYTRIIS